MAAPMLELNLKLKKAFVDVQAVNRAVDSGKRRSMIRSLAWIRRTWRGSLRRSKKASLPGQPPRIHAKGMSLKTILFAYDAATNSGVVGPVKLARKADTISSMPVPALLEAGGPMSVKVGRGRGRKRVRARMAARPSGAPVMREGLETGRIMDPWANMVTS